MFYCHSFRRFVTFYVYRSWSTLEINTLTDLLYTQIGQVVSSSFVQYWHHGCVYILLDTVLATDIIKYSPASARCQLIWRTHLANWIYFQLQQRTMGLSSYKTSHNKASVRVLVSQPITAYVGHIPWQLPVNSLVVANADPVIDMCSMDWKHCT